MRTELTEMAGVQARWLSMRQEAVATNVANASQPGFRAHTAPGFGAVLAEAANGAALDPARAVLPSGNTVDLAEQMIEGAEVGRAHSLNAAVTAAFHRMAVMVSQ